MKRRAFLRYGLGFTGASLVYSSHAFAEVCALNTSKIDVNESKSKVISEKDTSHQKLYSYRYQFSRKRKNIIKLWVRAVRPNDIDQKLPAKIIISDDKNISNIIFSRDIHFSKENNYVFRESFLVGRKSHLFMRLVFDDGKFYSKSLALRKSKNTSKLI